MTRNLHWLKARLIFYPTLAWSVLLARVLSVRNWWDRIDDYVVLGALPFARDIPRLAEAEGVKAVVNTCEEYSGPVAAYARYEIEQMRMPTIDFTHPQYDDVCRAVEFVDASVARQQTVYIHCKAGRARSATVAICWLMKNKQISAADAQQWLLEKRAHVNPRLTDRPVVKQFEQEFVN